MCARVMPSVGAAVRVVFQGASVAGVIERVDADGRAVEVLTVEDEILRFELSRATGRFMAGGQTGARLTFEPEM